MAAVIAASTSGEMPASTCGALTGAGAAGAGTAGAGAGAAGLPSSDLFTSLSMIFTQMINRISPTKTTTRPISIT